MARKDRQTGPLKRKCQCKRLTAFATVKNMVQQDGADLSKLRYSDVLRRVPSNKEP
jgi:hypothetical protein